MPIEESSTMSTMNSAGSYKDPLFLASNDHSNLVLTNELFNGNNYLNWSRGVKMALISKNKLVFVNGKFKRPNENSDNFQEWIRVDYTVMSWLLHSMTPTIARTMMYVTSSKQLWEEIKERYCQTNAPYLYQLKKDLSQIKQEGGTIAEYFGRLKSVWEDIQTLDGLPMCECGAVNSCTCELLKQIIEKDNRNKLMEFLMGLDNHYEPLWNQILGVDPLPTVNQAFFRIQQVEMQKFISNQDCDVSGGMAMAANKYNQVPNIQSINSDYKTMNKADYLKSKLEKQSLLCVHCNKTGHLMKDCFEIKGYPDWYKGSKGKKNSRNSNEKKFAGSTGRDGNSKNTENAHNYDNTPLDEEMDSQVKLLDQMDVDIIQDYLKHKNLSNANMRQASASFSMAGPFY
ncbi:unnamed protein product [Cuscuta epithymum]|uniref:CCHC-type domain-containing protein n=1 Tax=Cuscuta epithymum TaxID=186058 RepID=A0AAV0EH57_9ASTE|nr:unnamed protein product [Cuscuta epithymum]